MPTVPFSIIKYARTLWLSEMVLTYLHVDEQGCLVSWGGHPRHYGLTDLKTGMLASEQIALLEGLLPIKHTEVLEFVGLTCGRVAHIHLLPFKNGTWILLFDATAEHDRQQKTQQQANELSILTYRQSRLMEDLETMREKLEQEKQQLQLANEQKSRFIASLSHELRAPLASIIGYTRLLEDDVKTNEIEEYLNVVQNNSSHLLKLIDNVLDQAKLEIGKIQLKPNPCELKKFFEELRDLFFPIAKEKNLRFDVKVEGLLPSKVMIDEIRLRQVFINLINNALKFTAVGFVNVKVEWANNKLFIAISDSGAGISAEGIKKLFTAFYREAHTSNQQGAGLGLSITQQIVQLMEGEIRVESELGKGSTFFVEVNATNIETEKKDVAENKATQFTLKNGQRYKILVAEDTSILQILVKLYLRDHYDLVFAENGAEVLELAFSESPNLILMDLQMPIMNGFEASRHLRANGCQIPIIAISASSFSEDLTYAKQVGCNGYLTKPLDQNKLLQTIQQFLS